MLDILSNALIASLLLSISIAIVGPFMMIGRYNYLAASIAHGSYGGVGLALYFGTSILLGATSFAIALALLLAFITLKSQRTEILISVIWAVGMSIGVIFSDLTPGYHPDLLGYLFGDILLIPSSDLWFMAGVDLVIFIFFAIFYHHLLAIAYDREFAKTRGLPVGFLHTAMLLLIALTVVASIRAIGLILVIALFSIPPFVAERFSRNFTQLMIFSGLLALLSMVAGLVLAYYLDIAASAAIVLVAAALFFISLSRKPR